MNFLVNSGGKQGKLKTHRNAQEGLGDIQEWRAGRSRDKAGTEVESRKPGVGVTREERDMPVS